MNELEKLLNNPKWKDPNKQLPKKGQRVFCLLIKELIFEGNEDSESSEWKYDGQGVHVVLKWGENNKN